MTLIFILYCFLREASHFHLYVMQMFVTFRFLRRVLYVIMYLTY